MTMNQLRYFQTLARTEHYGRAAEQLYISQPSLSRAISLLEEELGVKLFAKQGRGVVLTRAGHEFLLYVDQGLAEIELGAGAMRQFSMQSENISLGCITPFLCDNAFRRLLWREVFSYGKLKPDTTVSQTAALIAGLKNHRYDLIFCSYSPSEPGIEFIPVIELPIIVAMRLDDPLAAMPVIHPSDLAGREMVINTEPVYSSLIKHVLDYYGVTPVVCGTSNEDLVLLHMVEERGALLIGTGHLSMYRSQTVLRPLQQNEFHRYIYMAFCRQASYRPGVEQIIELARDNALPEEGMQPKIK